MIAIPGYDIQARSGRIEVDPDADPVRFVTRDGEQCEALRVDRPMRMRAGDQVTAVYLGPAGHDGLGQCIALENHSRGQTVRWDTPIERHLSQPATGRWWERAVAVPSIVMVACAWMATQAPFGSLQSMIAWVVAGVCAVAALVLVLVLQRAAVRSQYARGRIEEARDALLAEGRKTITP